MSRPFLLAVMGPTASGKSALAEALADRTGALLLNADAFQVYRQLDIGTGKSDRRDLYSLLDIVDADESFGVGRWIRLAHALVEDLWRQGRSGIVVGGAGFYIRALMDEYGDMGELPVPGVRQELMREEAEFGLRTLVDRLRDLDPTAAERVDLSNPVRVRRALEKALTPAAPIHFRLPDFAKFKVATNPPPDILERSIQSRIEAMISAGWADEVAALLRLGCSPSCPGFRAIGYRQIADVVLGTKALAAAANEIFIATRQYAKRQKTWLRSEPSLHFCTTMKIEDRVAEIQNLMAPSDGPL